MFGHFRRLSKDVAIYGSSRILVLLLSFLTVPIFTRIFSTSDYGVMESIAAFASIILLICMLGMDSASQRSYFDYTPNQPEERTAVISSAFWLLLGWAAGIGIVLALNSRWISQQLLGSPVYAPLVAIAMITIPITVLVSYYREILRMRHEPVRFAVLSFLNSLLIVGGSLLLVAGFQKGLAGNYLGILIGSGITLGVSAWMLRDAIRPVFERREVRVMLAYGLPLVLVGASMLVLQIGDRFFLLHYRTLKEIGLYSLAVKYSNLLMLPVVAIGAAWSPFMLELNKSDPQTEPSVRAQALTIVTLVLAIGLVALSTFSREFFLVVTSPQFELSYRAIPWLCASILFLGMNTILMSGITISRQTKYFTQYTLIAVVINLALNFWLIPWLGYIGAAIATSISYFVLSGLYTYRSQRLSPAPFEYRRIALILGLSAGFATLGMLLFVTPLILGVLLKIGLLSTYTLLVLYLGLDAPTRRSLVQQGKFLSSQVMKIS
jgi:O-antigen/teichoic acid export membrane protein